MVFLIEKTKTNATGKTQFPYPPVLQVQNRKDPDVSGRELCINQSKKTRAFSTL